MKTPSTPTLAGIAAVLLWSTTVAFSRTLSEQMGPFSAGAAVYLLAGLLGLAEMARGQSGFARLFRLPRRYLLGCGALFAAYILLLYAAVGLAHSHAQVLAVGLANYLWPSLTLLFALPIQRRRASDSRGELVIFLTPRIVNRAEALGR